MNIKIMTRQDIAAAEAIDKAAFRKSWDAKELEDELAKDYAYYILLEDNGKAAGYAGIWCIYETAELIRIAVHPDAQGNGFADALMKDILFHAADLGCEHMLLEVRAGNAAAKGLYKKHGFTQIDLRRGYYDGEDAIIMERKLQ
ncbi:MAG: ribosomal protein S18-alanine N-acetyltransferase [Candidatus Ornithomonoglobus sp.]